ncbi:MAG: glycoside hydrolase [Paludibacter sp.]|nr:glycoside hydrolase [Paludibacter sp.]
MKKKVISLVTGLLFVFVCFPQTVQVQIDPSRTYQTIDGFAASDCWSGNYVGKYWDDDVKEQISKYLFSQNFSYNGSPEGIGLSMWRVNLGAGTYEQGDNSDIGDLSRRTECFLDSQGNYDWTKQSGQQYFMRKAKDYGCETFIGFCNSPPVAYTRNGKGYANGDGYSNLQEDKYDDFSNYLANVAKHFEDEDLPFSYITPLNEPQYKWDGTDQEGSPWQNDEIKKIAVEFDKAITEKNVSTRILLPESGSWTNLYQSSGRATDEIYAFFDPRSDNYIGDLTTLAPVASAHSYWTHYNNTVLQETRSNVKTYANKYNLKTYQTEWSLLSDAIGLPDSASYMDIALFMAKVIYSDLAFADVSSWSFWTSMDMERWDHKDRFLLLALEPGGNSYTPITTSGVVRDRSTLWALGNYSFFIRPGYKRIKMTGGDDLDGLLGTAYLSPDSDRIVVVYVNMAYETKKIATEFVNMEAVPVSNKRYVTNVSYNLRKYGSSTSDVYDPDKELSIPTRSVMTVVYELDLSAGLDEIKNSSELLSVFPNPVHAGSQVQIQMPGADSGEQRTLSVSSLTGSKLYKQNVDPDAESLSFSIPNTLAPGIYSISIQSGRYVSKNKLIVN